MIYHLYFLDIFWIFRCYFGYVGFFGYFYKGGGNNKIKFIILILLNKIKIN